MARDTRNPNCRGRSLTYGERQKCKNCCYWKRFTGRYTGKCINPKSPLYKKHLQYDSYCLKWKESQ